MGKREIEKVVPTRATEVPDDRPAIAVGQWYWVSSGKKKDRWFGCVVHVGSNYVQLEGLETRGSCHVSRVHLDNFDRVCVLEPGHEEVIRKAVEASQARVNQLMGRVRELTAALGVSPSLSISDGSETQALVLASSGRPAAEYKAALIRAKKEELPALFKQIEEAHGEMASWMTAQVIPMKAQIGSMKEVMAPVEERIFSVELYAGLVESVEKVRDGDPAPLDAKVHLLQRRHYMDEECLANYRTGGMEFKNLRAFDRWLCKDENLGRILPFPRCIVSFQVRRNIKARSAGSLSDFFRIVEEADLDKLTFLYIRNGSQVFRLNTEVEFGPRLFPDMETSILGEKIWARRHASSSKEFITERAHEDMVRREEEAYREWKRAEAAYKAALQSEEAMAKAKEKGLKEPNHTCVDHKLYSASWSPPHRDSDSYMPFDRSNVYYDDIARQIASEMRDHNRVGLIVQGLLDRSPVLHPHPPWQIWTDAGFRQALELVYDETRALVPGDAPDFEAYRARLNASLKAGSVTVGQEDAWELAEGEKESERRDRTESRSNQWRPERYRPYGDPGPGTFARVAAMPARGRCKYVWMRDRRSWRDEDKGKVRTTFTCDASGVLNVDAYRPGDFRIFFADPRTRADYLEWAPLLLEAEEYHAGNRPVPPPAEDPPPPPKTSHEGRRRYRMRKLRKELIGKAVRLTHKITTKGGDTYLPGSLWRVSGGEGRLFSIHGIRDDGTDETAADSVTASRVVRNVSHTEHDPAFVVDESVPAEPEAE